MDFRFADTFTDSLARLTSDEQKAVKTTASDLPPNSLVLDRSNCFGVLKVNGVTLLS